jgi:hypothetical protein
MKSIEFVKVGDKRRGIEVLKPGTYDLCGDGKHVVIRKRCSIETVETFEAGRWVGGGMHFIEPGWKRTGYHHDTLKVLPSRWSRLMAFIARREPPIPRAITIIDRGSK